MKAASEPSLADVLARENEKLRKIVRVLVDRVERSTDAQGNAFSLFQAAITLENTVRQRTSELQRLNDQLQQEIVERRAIEMALHDAKVSAERANLGKTEFLRAASHDLLQPLNVARLILDTLGENTHDAQSELMIERVERSLEAAESLLSTLLEISRIDAGALTPEIADVAIDPLLKHLSDEYAHIAEEAGLRLRVVPCDVVVRTDLRLLERVMRNFLSNAFRYTRAGGVLVGCRRRGDRLRIEVWDTGPGIPLDRLDDIFCEFLRLDGPEDRPGGMGLGLSIVDRLTRLLGGRIDVTSRVGRGSMFAISLPVGDVSRVGNATRAPHARGANGLFTGKTILVIGNERDVSTTLARQLRGWGLFTLEAQSLRGAVAVTIVHGVTPSVIIVADGAFEGTHARDEIDLYRARFGETIPAVLVTNDATENAGPSESGYWYLREPIRIERLRSLLNHLFTGR